MKRRTRSTTTSPGSFGRVGCEYRPEFEALDDRRHLAGRDSGRQDPVDGGLEPSGGPAVANAEVKNEREKAGIDVDNLVISKVTVDEGASMWRIRPRAQGRANWVQKRTSHVLVELEER